MTKKVIVVGAGFGGLSAAALLAKDGYEVKVIEKLDQPGGRASIWKKDGFTFDMGPSWYLMPDVFEKYFAEFGKKPEDYLDLVRLEPAYKVFFGKEDFVDVSSSLEKNLKLFESLEQGAGEKMKEYLESAKYQYDIAMKDFIYKGYHHITDFFKKELVVEGTKLHLFEKLDKYAKRYFESDRIRKILEYTIVFLGGTPYDSPALYSLLSHVDFNMGVWYPRNGGIGKVTESLYNLALSQGAEFEFNNPVTKIDVKDGILKGVETEKGYREADKVIVNADYAYAETHLLDEKYVSYNEKYWKKKKIAPSAYLMFLGLNKEMEKLTHHNLYFDPEWEEHFKEIFKKPKWPETPSYYVSCTSKTDPTVAPSGSEAMFVLVPVAEGLEDTEELREKYFEKIITHMEATFGESIKEHIVVKRIFAHKDFSERYNAYNGTALGFAHTLTQTAIFRPAMESKKASGLYYTGHYTHPGIGMPMVIIASQILADEIKNKKH